MKFAYGMKNVYDHPLSFLSAAEVADVRRAASQKKFPVLDHIPARNRLIGAFGLLGRYKGFDTVVRALHHLPKDHHLLIFGGVHPNEIKPHQPIDPVVSSLFDAGYVDASVAGRIRSNVEGTAPVVSLPGGRAILVGPDFAGLGARMPCHCVTHPYLYPAQPLPPQHDRILRHRKPTSNWPAVSEPARNSSGASIFRRSTSRPTKPSISPPMALRPRSPASELKSK